ncbi:hypothetical protein VPHK120G1_0051 [Vibrio phage K120 g1]
MVIPDGGSPPSLFPVVFGLRLRGFALCLRFVLHCIPPEHTALWGSKLFSELGLRPKTTKQSIL